MMRVGAQREQWSRSRSYEIAVFMSVLTVSLIVAFGSSYLFDHVPTLHIDVVAGLVVPFAIAFGPIGILAVAIAPIVRGALVFHFSIESLLISAAYALSGLVAYHMAQRVPIRDDRRALRGRRWLAAYAGIATAAAAVMAAVVGVGSEVLALSPFYLAGGLALQYWLVTLLVGLPLFVLVLVTWPDAVQTTRTSDGDTRFFLAIIGVALLWLLAGIVGSLGFYTLVRIPPWALHDVGLGPLVILADPGIFGRGAVRAQVVLAALAVSLLVGLLRAAGPTSGEST